MEGPGGPFPCICVGELAMLVVCPSPLALGGGGVGRGVWVAAPLAGTVVRVARKSLCC